jgi:hypothetical protein
VIQFLEVTPQRPRLGPRHTQDVDVARVAAGAYSPLDAKQHRPGHGVGLINLALGQFLKVVADHALAEARLVAYLALARKSDAVVGGSAGQPQQGEFAGRRQTQFPNPCSHLVAHGRGAPIGSVVGQIVG